MNKLKYLAFSLYAILCVIMGIATFIENSYGTSVAHKYIYGSWWFCLLWTVAIIASIPCVPNHFTWSAKSLILRVKGIIKRIKGTRTKGLKTIAIIAFSLSFSYASNAQPQCIKLSQAEELKYQQVGYNERICPLNTVARDFTQKITGKHTFKGLTSEQILLSWILHPEDWKDVRMIKVKKKAALMELGIKEDRACFSDFFDAQGNYRLEHNKYPDIEEKLTIIISATQGELFNPLPEGYAPLSDTKVKAEVLYNSIRWNLILFISCFILAILSFSVFASYSKKITICVQIGTAIVCTTLAACLALRWYIAEHVPLTNTFETMQVVALSTLVMACTSNKWRTYALIVSGATLLVTHISSLDPQVTPLMPALQSPWLASHVTTIMISYALFAILLFRPDRKVLIWAEVLLATGITLGSIWAKTAWGTYWSWDPKETWALISLIVYMYPLHEKSIPWFKDRNHKKWYLRFAFLTILMTYFGCNYILTGMHSYAQ